MFDFSKISARIRNMKYHQNKGAGKVKIPNSTIVHLDAFIDPSVHIGENVQIGQSGIDKGCYIDDGVIIGDWVHLRTGVIVLEGVTIEKQSLLYNGVRVGENSKIGDNVTLYRGVSVDKDCVIGNGVSLGNGVTIGMECKIANDIYVTAGAKVRGGVYLTSSVLTIAGLKYSVSIYKNNHVLEMSIWGETMSVSDWRNLNFSPNMPPFVKRFWKSNKDVINPLIDKAFKGKK